MITHIIYHIVGRKVGCTKDMEWRKRLYEEDEGIVSPGLRVVPGQSPVSDHGRLGEAQI